MNDLEKVIEKYFKDEKTLYFHPADRIANDQYLRWEYSQHERNKILVTVGSNDGEVDLKIFTDAQEFETFIKIIVF